MKGLNKVVNIVSYVIAIFIIIVLVYVIASKLILKKSYPNVFGYTYMQVKTGSMAPSLNINDIVIIKLKTNYKVNDIVTFEQDGYFITHRIIKMNGDKILTKGDSNNTEDDEIGASLVVGKVVKIISNSTYNLIKTICIGVIIIIIVYQVLKKG